MKLLITGASGQLGRCLIDRAASDDFFEFEAYGSAELDITNPEQVHETLRGYKPEIVINAAAYTAVDKAESDPEQAEKVNVLGPGNLARVCKKLRARLIHISTDYVFNGQALSPYLETDTTEPLGIYGKTKLGGEQIITVSGVDYLILRTAWVFSEYGNNFLKSMLKLAATKDHLGIVSDQIGCPTYAGDLAATILDICRQDEISKYESGVFHYVGASCCSWADFARQIFSHAKQRGMLEKAPEIQDISTSEYPTPAARPTYSILNTTKIQSRYSLSPRSLDKTLPEVLTALKKQYESKKS